MLTESKMAQMAYALGNRFKTISGLYNLDGRVIGYTYHAFSNGELIEFTRWGRIRKTHEDGEGYIVSRLHENVEEFLNPNLIHTLMPKSY